MADEAVLEVLIRAKDEATRVLQQLEKKTGLTAKQFKIAGSMSTTI